MQGSAGQLVELLMDFWQGGSLADPADVQLDVTFGSGLGTGTDAAGPFYYSDASSDTPGQVWRISTGQYAFTWQVPASAQIGAYVANWTCTYDGAEFLGADNIWIQGMSPASRAVRGSRLLDRRPDLRRRAGHRVRGDRPQRDDVAVAEDQGWDGAPVQGAGVIPRSGDHGAWASPQFYAARTLTLTCTASAQSQALRDVARAQLQQAVPISDLAVLRYDEPIPKVAYVRRSGAVTEAYPTLADVTFTVGLVAPDMRKYAATGKTVTISPVPSGGGGGMVVPFAVPFALDAAVPPGSTIAVNAGNFGSPPVAVINGPVTGPSLANLTCGRRRSRGPRSP